MGEEAIKDYFRCTSTPTKYSFSVYNISSTKTPDIDFINYLKEKLIFGYRPFDFYQRHFNKTVTEQEIQEYIEKQIIPKADSKLDRNIRQGDWGEIFATLVATYFMGLKVPISKLQWKFHKDKSVFGTDLLAFNNGEIKDLHYYEIKTRKNPNLKEGKQPNRYYVSIWAYNSLKKDADSPTSSIANFLEILFYEKGDYNMSSKFIDIVKNPQKYNSIYEIFLILEKNKYNENILKDLEAMEPDLSNLNVTIVLIDNLESLVNATWHDIHKVLVQKMHGKIKNE